MTPADTRAEPRGGLPEISLREASRARAAGRSLGRRTWGSVAVLAVAAATVASVAGSEALVNHAGLPQFGSFFEAALSPRLDPSFLVLTAEATATTLAYAVLGTALSLAIGLVGGILASETWWRSGSRGQRRRSRARLAGWAGARAALVMPRGVHEVIWGLFLLSVIGTEPVVAVLAIGIPFGAITAKVFSEILDETARGPYTALLASGARRPAAVAYGLVPPALSDLISYGYYRFECAIRSAAILGLIGAAGLGFQLDLSFAATDYEEMWTFLLALIVLSGAADAWSSVVRGRRSAPRGPAAQAIRAGRAARSAAAARGERSPRRDRVLVASVAVALALVPLSWSWLGLDLSELWSRETWAQLGQVVVDSWPPQLPEGGLGELARLSLVTLAMSVLAMAVAFAGGLALAFPAANLERLGGRGRGTRARRAFRLALAIATRAVLLFLRAIPPPVWALLVLFLFFPGILPGALALGVYTLGVLGRLMAEAAENLDERPLRALRAQGASSAQVFLYGVLPAAFPRFVAFALYRWEVTIRETVVVGVVGAGGLGLLLQRQLASFDYGGVVATVAALILLTLVVDLVSAAMRRSLR